jgi:hypothetical protein
MAETAAHLVDRVFPRQPVRQWVLSVPKRLRYFLQHDPAVVSSVLHIFLRVVEEALRQSSPGAGLRARFGAVSFVHRFGSALNAHLHFHCAVIDGVFQPDAEGRLCFHEAAGLTQERIAKVQEQVRRRVLRAFVHRGLLEPEAARNMRGWEGGGGFSVDASIRVEAYDRSGLERLLRYCARPPFALERLAQAEGQALIYRLPKALPDGKTQLRLAPLELLDRLAAIIPPPRLHRHRYHGVLAPNAPWRAQVTTMAAQAAPEAASAGDRATEAVHRPLVTSLWAMLLARIYEVLPLVCPRCEAPMRIIAFVTDTPSVTRILQHLGEPTQPPRGARPSGRSPSTSARPSTPQRRSRSRRAPSNSTRPWPGKPPLQKGHGSVRAARRETPTASPSHRPCADSAGLGRSNRPAGPARLRRASPNRDWVDVSAPEDYSSPTPETVEFPILTRASRYFWPPVLRPRPNPS